MRLLLYPPVDITREPTAFIVQRLYYRAPEGYKLDRDAKPAVGTANAVMRAPLSYVQNWVRNVYSLWPEHMKRPGYRALLQAWASEGLSYPARWVDWVRVTSPDFRMADTARERKLAQVFDTERTRQ